MLSTAHTVTLPTEVVQAAALVGQVVTHSNRQWHVHGVEGRDFYAFNQDGRITIDTDMTPSNWITEPIALLIPMGHKHGEGFGVSCEVSALTRGVCLTKW